jgi:hypothetical protein
MASLLQELLEEFREKIVQLDETIPREIVFADIPNKIKVAIGMRRTGKTYFLLQKIKNMVAENPALLTRVLYLNFEDDRLLPLTATKLADLLSDFYTLYPENHQQRCYLVLDEIQNVTQWEQVVRRFLIQRK